MWGNQTSGSAIVQNKNVEQFADLVVLIYEVISLFSPLLNMVGIFTHHVFGLNKFFELSAGSVNRPQFGGGSKVSMDGAYGKKVTELPDFRLKCVPARFG